MVLLLAGLFQAMPAAADETEKVFGFYCAQCHGLEGKGDGPNVTKDFPVSPRNFTNAEEMNKLSDADLKNVILDGGPAASKSPMMPPWGKTLSEARGRRSDQAFAYALRLQGKAGLKHEIINDQEDDNDIDGHARENHDVRGSTFHTHERELLSDVHGQVHRPQEAVRQWPRSNKEALRQTAREQTPSGCLGRACFVRRRGGWLGQFLLVAGMSIGVWPVGRCGSRR